MVQGTENQGQVSTNELRPYELFMLMLCMYSLMTLAAETFFHFREDEVAILDAVDNVVCGIFLLDFLAGLALAPSKFEFLKWGWIDLVSSIPVVDLFRAGRIVRVIRILRVLRGIRLARIMGKYLLRHRADGTILAAIFTSIMLVVLSSVAILQVEQKDDGANIQSGSDALWWAITTMTTVGYGDKYPVTTIGRIIASILMVSGVGLFGTLSGFVTSWILNPVEERQEVDLGSIHTELDAIQKQLQSLTPIEIKTSTDPELDELIRRWPQLTNVTRNQIKKLVTSEWD